MERMLIDGREAARMLSISLRHLQDLVKEGLLKCVHLGRSVRFDVGDLAAMVERLKSGQE